MNKEIFVIRLKNLEDYKFVKSIALSYGYKFICSGPGYNALYFDKNKRTMENSLSLLEAKYIEDTFYFDEDNLAIMEKLREGWVKFDVPKNGEVYENFNDKPFTVTGSFTVDKNNFKKGGNMNKNYFAVVIDNPAESELLQEMANKYGYNWFERITEGYQGYQINCTNSKLLFFDESKRKISSILSSSEAVKEVFNYKHDFLSIEKKFKKGEGYGSGILEQIYGLGVTIKGEKLCLIKREPMGGGKTEYKLKAGCSKEYDIEDFYLLYNWVKDHEKVTNIFNRIFTEYKLTDSKWKIFNLTFFDGGRIDISREKIEEIKELIDKHLNK